MIFENIPERVNRLTFPSLLPIQIVNNFLFPPKIAKSTGYVSWPKSNDDKTLFSFVGQSGLSICKVYLRARIFFVLENQSCQCTAPLFIFFHFSWEHTSQIKALFVQTFIKKNSALTQLEKCPLSPSTLSSVPRVNDEDSKAINRLAVSCSEK